MVQFPARRGHHFIADSLRLVIFAVKIRLALLGQGGELVGVVRVVRPPAQIVPR